MESVSAFLQPPSRVSGDAIGHAGGPGAGIEATGISAIADSLARAGCGAFGAAGSEVEWVQTHISHVFLVADRVYKLRKAVDLGFVDFSTRALRNADCVAELRLNRRISPDVYLGIAPIVPGGEGVRIGRLRADPALEDLDAANEHCVVMKRLPAGRDARTLLERGMLRARDLDAVVETLARFHADNGLGRPAPGASDQWRARVQRVVSANFESMRKRSPNASWSELVTRVESAASAAFQRLQAELDRRWREGRMVDGHGDLHLEHIWFPGRSRRPVFVDCIEFNDEFRLIDRASEIAFLAMDLTYRGRSDLAERAVAAYAAATDDYHLFSVVDFHASYRAAVRAKVAALTSDEREVPRGQRDAAASSALRHLELAGRYLQQPPVGAVVCMTGTVGSGKTTAARELAARTGAVTISTDAVRRSLDESGCERGGRERYGLQRRRQVYAAVFERAAWVVRSGRTVILDATFESAALRSAALQWASSLGASAFLVRTTVAASVAAARLEARRHDPNESSEAGPAQLEGSLARYEAPTEWPAAAFTIDTDRDDWQQSLEPLTAALAELTARNARPDGSMPSTGTEKTR